MPKEKVHTVSQITRAVRRLLESEIGEVWVEGEVSNFRLQASGHQYFTLKDAGAQLSCAFFRGNASRSRIAIENGMQIQAFGEITVYEARGQYQMIVRRVQDKGEGALQAKFEALKRKLAAEGLFDEDEKAEIPAFPRTVALVTSPTGAALRDMLNILGRRAPWVRVLVYPVRVQGAGAEKEIAEAIEIANAGSESGDLPEIDTLVVGRGGGSIEDLWNFNEEIVARAIAASAIPVVSAVGHEIDFTIADFAADLRAPTPSAAAELIVPEREELRERLRRLRALITRSVEAKVEHQARVLELIGSGVLRREPARILAELRQRTDYLADSVAANAKAALAQHQVAVANAARVLQLSRPDRALERREQKFSQVADRFQTSARHHLQQFPRRRDAVAALLRSLGPEAVFARGFSMTADEEGNTLTDPTRLVPGQRVHTRLAGGSFTSTVDE